MVALKQDLALAVRRLLQAPELSMVIIVTLAVGIGLTTVVFALVDAVVLRPLPFRDPGRMVLPWVTRPDGSRTGLSYPDFLDLQAKSRGFAYVAFHSPDQFTLRHAGGLERIQGAWVSAGYFPALGLEPILGRLLTRAEADPPGAPVVVLGHGLWQRRFGGDPRIVGQTIELNQVRLTVVGVLPPEFRGLQDPAEIFVPVALFERLCPSLRHLALLTDRDLAWGRLLGRLAPGTGMAEALADLRAASGEQRVGLAEAREVLLGDLRPRLWRLLGAACFVLLIACANVGHLQLTRVAGRHRETAVRAALGADRGQLIRHELLEGLLLGAAGGAAGLLLTGWSLSLLTTVLPLDIPAAIEVRTSARVVAFALGLALLGGGLSALAPALHSAWPDLAGSLKQGGLGASESPASRRTRGLLVVADVALALMLLIGAGLMVRSMDRIRGYDPGFHRHGILTLRFEPPGNATDAERVRIKQEVLERTVALPGARAAALTSHIYFDRQPRLRLEIITERFPAKALAQAQVYFVSSGFFQALGIPLEAGRDFVRVDHRPPARVALVNRAFVDLYLPPGEPLGRWVSLRSEPGNRLEVIGVAGNVRNTVEPGDSPEIPQLYLPALESPTWGFNLVLATEGDPGALVAPVRSTIRGISPATVAFDVAPLDARIADATSDTRFFTELMGIFAGTALALAALGIYSLIASMVQRETRDVAVRRALGAGPGAILRQILIRGLPPVLAGIALGLCGAVVLARTLSLVLFEVAPLDPATFIAVPLLFAIAALSASLLAAQRALEIEPMAALRE